MRLPGRGHFNGTTFRGSLHLPFSDFRGPLFFNFASVGAMQSGRDDVLYGSHLHQPERVEWGLIPPRITRESERSGRFHAGEDPSDAPVGAILFFGEVDAD